MESVFSGTVHANRHDRADLVVAGRQTSNRSSRFAGDVQRVLYVFDPTGVADDRAGLGDEYFSTRRGVHGAVELHHERGARDSRRVGSNAHTVGSLQYAPEWRRAAGARKVKYSRRN